MFSEMNCILDTNDVFLPYKALIGKSYDVSVKSSSIQFVKLIMRLGSELIWNDTPFAYENKNGTYFYFFAMPCRLHH